MLCALVSDHTIFGVLMDNERSTWHTLSKNSMQNLGVSIRSHLEELGVSPAWSLHKMHPRL